MTRTLERGQKLIVASHNAGKIREIGDLVRPFGLDVISAGDLGLPEPEETESTFVGNAELKARAAATAVNLPALADDSGLEVHALAGAPGIYSARWAGPEKDFTVAMKRVMHELSARDAQTENSVMNNSRTANFTCALSLAWPDGHCDTFEGKIFGSLVWPMRGDKGFGYDSIFIPEGHDKTFAEMEPAEKHAMSHRARAFEQFVAVCLNDHA
jgi:XTP/dITP diphosphohydrolase